MIDERGAANAADARRTRRSTRWLRRGRSIPGRSPARSRESRSRRRRATAAIPNRGSADRPRRESTGASPTSGTAPTRRAPRRRAAGDRCRSWRRRRGVRARRHLDAHRARQRHDDGGLGRGGLGSKRGTVRRLRSAGSARDRFADARRAAAAARLRRSVLDGRCGVPARRPSALERLAIGGRDRRRERQLRRSVLESARPARRSVRAARRGAALRRRLRRLVARRRPVRAVRAPRPVRRRPRQSVDVGDSIAASAIDRLRSTTARSGDDSASTTATGFDRLGDRLGQRRDSTRHGFDIRAGDRSAECFRDRFDDARSIGGGTQLDVSALGADSAIGSDCATGSALAARARRLRRRGDRLGSARRLGVRERSRASDAGDRLLARLRQPARERVRRPAPAQLGDRFRRKLRRRGSGIGSAIGSAATDGRGFRTGDRLRLRRGDRRAAAGAATSGGAATAAGCGRRRRISIQMSSPPRAATTENRSSPVLRNACIRPRQTPRAASAPRPAAAARACRSSRRGSARASRC